MIVFHPNELRQASWVRVACFVFAMMASALGLDVNLTLAASPDRSVQQAVTLPEGCLELIGPAGLRTYLWDFSRRSDVDFDKWPDGWNRYEGRGYPKYVTMSIQARRPDVEAQVLPLDTALVLRWPKWRANLPILPPLPPSLADLMVNYCFQIELDGGLARVTSPMLPTSDTYQYHFSVDVHTDHLKYDQAVAVVVFLDRDGKEISQQETARVGQTRGWQTLRIEKLMPPSNARQMYVRLEVIGGDDGTQDIRGVIRFDNIKFEQFPQMMVATDHPLGIYRYRDVVRTTTKLLGLPGEATNVRLRLLNQDNQLIRTATRRLTADQIQQRPNDSLTATGDSQDALGPEESPEMAFDWELADLPPGFYRLAASMENDRGASLANETTFVVIDRLSEDPREWSPPAENLTAAQRSVQQFFQATEGASELKPLPFGWTLPAKILMLHRTGQLSEKQIADWLRDVGVGWAKLPVWFAPEEHVAADAAAALAFRLRDRGITPVGMLDQPSPEQLKNYQLRSQQIASQSGVPAGVLLADPAVWRPQLDSIMNRLTLRMRIWQLGGDEDYGFGGRPELSDQIETIANGLQGFGQPLDVMIPWPWMDSPPDVQGGSWAGLLRSTQPEFTAEELDAILDMEESSSADSLPLPPAVIPNARDSDGENETVVAIPRPKRGYKTWLQIDPISSERYDLAARIKDLVLRMATVRGHEVEAAFVSRPMDPLTGLFDDQGHPRELLLPWRTASTLLGRTRNIGSLQLRGETNNIVFEGEHTSVLLIWSDGRPQTEQLFLGDSVYQVDVWGRKTSVPVKSVDGRKVHEITAGPVPKFVVGIDSSLARFRMSVQTTRQRIDSILGRSQPLGIEYRNPIGQTLQGTLSLQVPRAWSVLPQEDLWDLSPRASGRSDFEIILGNGATIGKFELPIDFQFETTPPTRIRVYRKLEVGPDGFDLHVSTRQLGNQMRVTITMTNRTPLQANFDCLLFAGPTRQYERRILSMSPGETAQRVIDWSDPESLIGQQMLLRAIEQDGRRVINHTFEVKP